MEGTADDHTAVSPTGADMDRLPPEGRFAIRGLAAGLTVDAVAEVLREDGPTVRKHLRSVVRSTGGDPPPASASDEVLLATLLPALALAKTPPARVPALRCPEDPMHPPTLRGTTPAVPRTPPRPAAAGSGPPSRHLGPARPG